MVYYFDDACVGVLYCFVAWVGFAVGVVSGVVMAYGLIVVLDDLDGDFHAFFDDAVGVGFHDDFGV